MRPVTAAPTVVEFSAARPDGIGHRIASLAVGGGWANLVPVVAEDDPLAEPEPSGVFGRLFTNRGPAVPLCTVVPGAAGGRRSPAPTTLGIQHGWGARAVPRLREQGLTLPGCRVVADNSRRGLVVEAPLGADPEDLLRWLLDAAVALSRRPLPDAWRAALYEGR